MNTTEKFYKKAVHRLDEGATINELYELLYNMKDWKTTMLVLEFTKQSKIDLVKKTPINIPNSFLV